MLALAACGPVDPSLTATVPAGSPTATVPAEPSPTAVPAEPSPTSTVAAEPPPDCLLATEPGASDEPPRGSSELDLSDFGAGRYRLCLTGPITGTFERTAWCVWTPDRTAVTSVHGLPAKLGDTAYDAYAPLGSDEFQLGLTDPVGLVSTYTADADHLTSEVGEAGRSGDLAFEVKLYVDPESSAPPDAPPTYAGAMRWLCGDPPPP
jgi:hypothetical protein